MSNQNNKLRELQELFVFLVHKNINFFARDNYNMTGNESKSLRTIQNKAKIESGENAS